MALSENTMLKCSEHLSAYKSACEDHPDLKDIANCIEKAEMGQLLIQEAVAEFHKESAENDVGGKKKKYEKIMKKLKAFKAMGDPFDSQVLTTQFELIKKQQDSLLVEVTTAKEKIQKEIAAVDENIKTVNAVFGAASFAAVLLAAGWALAYNLLENKKNDLNKQLEDLKKVEDEGINTNEEATKTVSTLVKGLEDRIVNMLELVDNAIDEIEENEKAMRLVLNLLSEKVEILTKNIKEVGESVKKHSALIAEARLKVQEKIVHG